jgi:hypothetical protein
MADNGNPYRNSWRRLIVGAPLTFVLFFTVGMALDWRSKPVALNIVSSLLDAMFFTIGVIGAPPSFMSSQLRGRDRL